MNKTIDEKIKVEQHRVHKLMIRLPESIYEELRAVSYKRRIPIAAICREAIIRHLKSEGSQ